MIKIDADELRDLIAMVEVIKRHGDFAYGNDIPEQIAIDWYDWNILPEEADAWLSVRCFTPEAAHQLEDYDITPEQARKITDRGIVNYRDTIGYKVANCDLAIEAAIKEVEDLN
jgi:hypothetical protein